MWRAALPLVHRLLPRAMPDPSKKRKLDDADDINHSTRTNVGRSAHRENKKLPRKSLHPAPSPSSRPTARPQSSKSPSRDGSSSEPTSVDKGKGNAAQAADSDASKAPIKVNKLVPPRPFPTVPVGVNATGPRSAHHEGKNFIAITRKTSLGAYLRRCKDIVLKDGCVRVYVFSSSL